MSTNAAISPSNKANIFNWETKKYLENKPKTQQKSGSDIRNCESTWNRWKTSAESDLGSGGVMSTTSTVPLLTHLRKSLFKPFYFYNSRAIVNPLGSLKQFLLFWCILSRCCQKQSAPYNSLNMKNTKSDRTQTDNEISGRHISKFEFEKE